jgi:cyclase
MCPLTVGGGIRTLHDIERMLRSGADKVAINTAALDNPRFIRDAALRFGSQCVVVSIEARKTDQGWECMTDCGRNHTDWTVKDWCQEVALQGAGEILLTSIDRDGTQAGYDLALLQEVTSKVNLPVIISGGFGSPQDLQDAYAAGADGMAIAHALHYEKVTLSSLRQTAMEAGLNIRCDEFKEITIGV